MRGKCRAREFSSWVMCQASVPEADGATPVWASASSASAASSARRGSRTGSSSWEVSKSTTSAARPTLRRPCAISSRSPEALSSRYHCINRQYAVNAADPSASAFCQARGPSSVSASRRACCVAVTTSRWSSSLSQPQPSPPARRVRLSRAEKYPPAISACRRSSPRVRCVVDRQVECLEHSGLDTAVQQGLAAVGVVAGSRLQLF